VTDKVGPRGEIIIGGHHVAKGYYNMPEQTAAEFYDENGKRWFKSGDIGQVIFLSLMVIGGERVF
jgi:long-chain acyl-CoA synthetase